MEWVETTGRSIEEAKDAALDQLGVDEQEAEFEIIEEPRTGLFGRMRAEARIRARIKPTVPRPKVERRDRGRRARGKAADKSSDSSGGEKAEPATTEKPASASSGSRERGRGGRGDKPAAERAERPERAARTPRAARAKPTSEADEGLKSTEAAGTDEVAKRPPRKARSRSTPTERAADRAATETENPAIDADSPRGAAGEGRNMTDDTVTVAEQAELTTEFLSGLLDAFGVEGSIDQTAVDDETIEVNVTGDELGLLIGPKGLTLVAVQDLCRTFVQRKATGHHEGRVRIDVGGYRQRRREALERFAQQMAAQVLEEGKQKALEPMVASDRKVVHDTVNTIDGVCTLSEGEDPRRRVVIVPE